MFAGATKPIWAELLKEWKWSCLRNIKRKAKTNSEKFNILVQMVQKAQNLPLLAKKNDLFPFGQ